MKYEKLTENFTQVDNAFLEALFSARLTKNEISVLAVIFRGSYMCQRDYCDLKRTELTTFGTRISHYKEALMKLEAKGIISREEHGSFHRFSINEEKIMELANINQEYLREILSRNLPQKGRDRNQKSNINVPKTGTVSELFSPHKRENIHCKEKEPKDPLTKF